jgi:hypothetical protein
MNEFRRTPRYLIAAISTVAVLLAFGLFCHYRAYANVRKVKQLQASFREQGRNLTPDERRETGQQMRDAMQKLSPQQRHDLSAEGRKRFEERMRSYVKMSKDERTKFLDQQLDRMESMRQQFANSGNFNGGPRNRGQSDERSRRQRLDQSTPEFRAAMDQFRHDMEQRRRQRGMGGPPGR